MLAKCYADNSCINANCSFKHSKLVCKKPFQCNNNDCSLRHAKEFCHYDTKCIITFCKFRHSTEICNDITNCINRNCVNRHAAQFCKYDLDCIRDDCAFRHSEPKRKILLSSADFVCQTETFDWGITDKELDTEIASHSTRLNLRKCESIFQVLPFGLNPYFVGDEGRGGYPENPEHFAGLNVTFDWGISDESI